MESQKEEEDFAYISGGETKSINYPLIINNNYASMMSLLLYMSKKNMVNMQRTKPSIYILIRVLQIIISSSKKRKSIQKIKI